MQQDERITLLTIALLAVFANGGKNEQELAQLRHVLEKLSTPIGANLSLLLQDVQLKRHTIVDSAPFLQRPESRQKAYEAAVCICDVDGVHSDPEHRFLEELRIALALDVRSARSFERAAGLIADLPMQPDPVRGFAKPVNAPDSQALEQNILNVAAFSAALARNAGLLQALGIAPLQMKMIYRIAKAHGEEAARGQIRDLMIVFGAAALSQYVQSFALSLCGEREQAAAIAFANSYALGHTARFYYASDIDIEQQTLREHFERLHAQGLALYPAQSAEIENKTRILNSNELTGLLRTQ